MNIAEITARLYAISAAILEKTGERPWLAPFLKIQDGQCTVNLVRGFGDSPKFYDLGSARGKTLRRADATPFQIAAALHVLRHSPDWMDMQLCHGGNLGLHLWRYAMKTKMTIAATAIFLSGLVSHGGGWPHGHSFASFATSRRADPNRFSNLFAPAVPSCIFTARHISVI